MRAYDLGSAFSVAVSEQDLTDFMCQWPCSGFIGLHGITFTFENSGDLVDVRCRNGKSEDWDGAALVALSHDAQVYGSERMQKTRAKKAKKGNGHGP